MRPDHLFRQMDEAAANEVACWRYEPPYDFYDSAADPEDLAELLDPERRRDVYFSVLVRGELAGFFQFEVKSAAVELGLGLRPDLTGRGLGLDFLLSGMEFASERFAPERFTLAVATFNGRAIRTYERAAFRRGETYTRETNGGRHPFLSMERGA